MYGIPYTDAASCWITISVSILESDSKMFLLRTSVISKPGNVSRQTYCSISTGWDKSPQQVLLTQKGEKNSVSPLARHGNWDTGKAIRQRRYVNYRMTFSILSHFWPAGFHTAQKNVLTAPRFSGSSKRHLLTWYSETEWSNGSCPSYTERHHNST